MITVTLWQRQLKFIECLLSVQHYGYLSPPNSLLTKGSTACLPITEGQRGHRRFPHTATNKGARFGSPPNPPWRCPALSCIEGSLWFELELPLPPKPSGLQLWQTSWLQPATGPLLMFSPSEKSHFVLGPPFLASGRGAKIAQCMEITWDI